MLRGSAGEKENAALAKFARLPCKKPMDLDYRALSNAGLWFLGRLQTDAERARVLDGLAAARGTDASVTEEPGTTLQRLAPHWFVVPQRGPHDGGVAHT